MVHRHEQRSQRVPVALTLKRPAEGQGSREGHCDPQDTRCRPGDRHAFLHWVVKPVSGGKLKDVAFLDDATAGFSAASFASLRSELIASAKGKTLDADQILEIISDYLPPAIRDTRRSQTLQALVNCSRRSLLPDPTVDDEERARWSEEIRELEAKGIR